MMVPRRGPIWASGDIPMIGSTSSWLRPCAAAFGLAVLVASPVAAGADTISVEDSRGQSVQVERPVAGVAIFPLPIPEALIAIDGGTKRLVAINPRARTALMNGVIGQLFPEIADIRTDPVTPNFIPSVEEILKA